MILTSAFFLTAVEAKVDDLTFVENREMLWYEGVEIQNDEPSRIGEHQEQKTHLTQKLPEELSVPLNHL
jgi:hypothetical protein